MGKATGLRFGDYHTQNVTSLFLHLITEVPLRAESCRGVTSMKKEQTFFQHLGEGKLFMVCSWNWGAHVVVVSVTRDRNHCFLLLQSFCASARASHTWTRGRCVAVWMSSVLSVRPGAGEADAESGCDDPGPVVTQVRFYWSRELRNTSTEQKTLPCCATLVWELLGWGCSFSAMPRSSWAPAPRGCQTHLLKLVEIHLRQFEMSIWHGCSWAVLVSGIVVAGHVLVCALTPFSLI